MKNSKKKKLTHGDIVSIPIFDRGYIYAKYIDVSKVLDHYNYPDVLRIYQGLYSEKINDDSELNRKLLLPPINIAGLPAGLKNCGWEIFKSEKVSQDEQTLPDVKEGHPPDLFGYDESKYDKWVYLRNLGNNVAESHYAKYDQVKHLEWSGSIDVDVLPFRVLLELFKLEGKDIKNELGTLDWLEEIVYERSINTPPYSTQSVNTRDFALRI